MLAKSKKEINVTMHKMVMICTYEEAILISQVDGIHPMETDS